MAVEPQVNLERGYRGPNIGILPGDFGDRVKEAATFTSSSGGLVKFSLASIELRPDFGVPQDGSDFFLSREDGMPVGSVHFVPTEDGGHQAFTVSFLGVENLSIRGRVERMLGFNSDSARVVNEVTRIEMARLLGLRRRLSDYACRGVRRQPAGTAVAQPPQRRSV